MQRCAVVVFKYDVAVKSHDMLHRRAFSRNFARNVVMRLGAGEDGLCAGIVDYIFHLVGAAGRINRHGHCAVAVAGEVGDQYLAAVGRKNGYILLRLDSEHLEGAGRVLNTVGKLAPRAGAQCASRSVDGGECHSFAAVTPCLLLDYMCENIGHQMCVLQ